MVRFETVEYNTPVGTLSYSSHYLLFCYTDNGRECISKSSSDPNWLLSDCFLRCSLDKQKRYPSSLVWEVFSWFPPLHYKSMPFEVYDWISQNTSSLWTIEALSRKGNMDCFWLVFEDEAERTLFDLRFS